MIMLSVESDVTSLLHFPGMLSFDWFDRITGSSRMAMYLVFVSGYLETTLFLIVLILSFRWIRAQTSRNPTS